MDQLNLIEGLPEQTRPARKIHDMHVMFGTRSDKTCKTCALLIRNECSSRTYLKCAKNRNTAGPGTDWRAGYQACGLYREGAEK